MSVTSNNAKHGELQSGDAVIQVRFWGPYINGSDGLYETDYLYFYQVRGKTKCDRA